MAFFGHCTTGYVNFNLLDVLKDLQMSLYFCPPLFYSK